MCLRLLRLLLPVWWSNPLYRYPDQVTEKQPVTRIKLGSGNRLGKH